MLVEPYEPAVLAEPDLATHSMVHLYTRSFATYSMVHLYTLVVGLVQPGQLSARAVLGLMTWFAR